MTQRMQIKLDVLEHMHLNTQRTAVLLNNCSSCSLKPWGRTTHIFPHFLLHWPYINTPQTIV